MPPSKAQVAKAQLELLQREAARRRLMTFVRRLNAQYLPGWVHEDICRRLEQFSDDVTKGLSPRLMLLMPPRSGKSELASRMFPAWHLGRNPDHEIISCGYNVSLAMTFSRKVKEAIESPEYQTVFETRLHPDFRSNEEWALANGRGGYVAAGVGGGITGRGCHILTIDDPIKNAEEADSIDTREKLWDWYGSTAYTRLAPGGGVLVIQCMTGDTPVLMPDGAQHRLDTLAAGNRIATFDQGALSTSKVLAVRSNGHDSVFRITTTSGKMVRANGRHPFLVAVDGDLKWVRTRALTTAHKIVALKGSGGSGAGSHALPTSAASQPSAEGSARRTTTSRSGPTGTARRVSTLSRTGPRTSSTGTASPLAITTPSLTPRAGCAPSAETLPALTSPTTGRTSSPSTIVMPRARSGASCATDATQESDIFDLSPWHLPQRSTSDFTLEEVSSVAPDGVEEVFDLQVERTENFIANGLVSHNTHWHDDDLAGRLKAAMAADEEADQFVVVKYPAIAEEDEYLDYDTDLIVCGAAPDNGRLLRHQGDALHPDRYDLAKLNRIKRTISPRFWSALYQQNPVPDDGGYFTKDQFRSAPPPSLKLSNVFIAWDFAISEKKQNDYTVGTVALQDFDDVLHVVDQVRFKSGDAFYIVESILNLASRWHNSSLVVGFEDGQIYRAIEALLKKRMKERGFYPSTVVLKPITDKLARGRALQGRMQQGMVSFASGAPWADSLRTEMLRFPAGAHDDQVDSLSWTAQLAVGREAPRRPTSQKPKSWKDKLRDNGTLSHMVA